MTHYLSTLRYLTFGQMWHRGVRMTRRRWWRLIGKRSPHPKEVVLRPVKPLFAGLDGISGCDPDNQIEAIIERAILISEGHFCFLQQPVSFGSDIRWNEPAVSQLWRYQLHYFDYVSDLMIWGALQSQTAAYDAFRRLSLSWIESNESIAGDGWHPYTISLRVVNWLHAALCFSDQLLADPDFRERLLASIYGQTQVLFANLEFDVRGNHLIENLRALIWAGIAFQGLESRRWLERGLRVLEKEVDEQVLTDGGHFERSPGYQVIVFRDLLEIAVWLKRNADGAPVWLDDAVRRMGHYLQNIMPRDGKVPLLKDSTWDSVVPAFDLLAACALYLDESRFKNREKFGLYPVLIFGADAKEKFGKWKTVQEHSSAALRPSGHYVIRDDASGDHLIFDAGKPCPDYLPAHAHADMLGYELSSSNQKIIVDSGVYEYAAGPWRDFFRSTRAHNTVEVAFENQSEVWSSFRVGERARPGPVFWESTLDGVLVQGEHDGYRRLSVPVIHQRSIFARYRRFWLIVDQVWGSGKTALANHLHLHPDLCFEQVDEHVWQIGNRQLKLWLTTFGESTHSVVSGQLQPFSQGWYSPSFGDLRPNSVLTLNQDAALPVCFGYIIARDEPAQLNVTKTTAGNDVTIISRGLNQRLRLVRNERPRLT